MRSYTYVQLASVFSFGVDLKDDALLLPEDHMSINSNSPERRTQMSNEVVTFVFSTKRGRPSIHGTMIAGLTVTDGSLEAEFSSIIFSKADATVTEWESDSLEIQALLSKKYTLLAAIKSMADGLHGKQLQLLADNYALTNVVPRLQTGMGE